MSNDYPNYYPPFMRDFHQQKELFKAFFVWRQMMDARSNATCAQLSNFRDFMILFASFVDFMFQHGWQIQRTRKPGEYTDIDDSVKALNDLEMAWLALVGVHPLPVNLEKCVDVPMKKWEAWLEFMPPDVRQKWESRQAETAQAEVSCWGD